MAVGLVLGMMDGVWWDGVGVACNLRASMLV